MSNMGDMTNAISVFISNTTQSNEALKEIIQLVKAKPIEAINEVLLICNDYVSSKQIPFKHRTMELLNELIEVNISSIQMIIFGYIQKTFKDISCIPLSIKALYKLYTYLNEDAAALKELVLFVNEMYTCDKLNLAAYNQETRNYGLKLLSKLIPKYSFNKNEAIKISGVVIDCIEGEKDPRNLLLVFTLVSIIYKVFPYSIINPFDKTIYDILIDYYPIDFTPPKNSPDTITAKDLSIALNEVMAIEYFSSFYFEDINQYDSTPSDVFSTIQAITAGYSNEGIVKYYTPISNFIINTIMNNSEEELHIEGLVTYNFFIKRICLCKGYEMLLRNTFEYLADQLFSTEDIKRSCDSKDFLCVLLEHSHDSVLIQNSFEVIVKALSHFLLTKQYFFLLKNINSLLFFSNKKIDANIPSIIIDNKKLFIILQEVMNELPKDKETFAIVIIDILSAIAVKFKGVYNKEEISGLLDQIKTIYYANANILMVNLNHIAYCISEIIKMYPELDWSDEIISNKSLKNNDKISKQDIALLKAILMSSDKQDKIFSFFIDNLDNKEVLIILQQICKENYKRFQCLFEANSTKINEVMITNCNRKEYYPLISELSKRNTIINQQELLMKLLNDNNSDSITQCNIFLEQYELIKEMIINSKIDHDNIYDILISQYNQFNKTKELNANNHYCILKKIGKCIYFSIKNSSKEKKAKIQSLIFKEIEIFFNEKNESIISNKESLLSYHLNAIIADYQSEVSSADIIKLINCWFNEFTSLALTSPIITSQCYYKSKLFKIQMPIEIREMIQIKLKSNRTLEKPVLALMLNIYSKQQNEEKEDDILFILYSKALLLDIQVKSSIKEIKRLLSKAKNIETFKRGYSNMKDLISKLILLLLKAINIELKVDILKLLGLLRYFIEFDEEYFRSVSIQLKKCLSDRKRKVRRICGVTITIWNLIE